MSLDYQTLLSLVIVALAAVYLTRQVVLLATRPDSRGCGTCPSNKSCGANRINHANQSLPLVQLGGPLRGPNKSAKTNEGR